LVEENKNWLKIIRHELKNPLTSLVDIIQLIKRDTNFDKELKDKLETAKYLAKNSLGVIDNISCFYDEVIQEEIEKINVIKLIDDIKGNYLLSSKAKNITFNIKIDKKIKYLYTDRSKLFQVLSNLFSNAVKYSPKNEEIQILIKKYKSKVQFVFENNKLSLGEIRKVKSSKIGLKVVKKIADKMNWKLTISDKDKYKVLVSVIDKGSVVNYTSDHIYHMIKNKVVLLLEDDIISSKLTENLLSRFVKKIDVIDEFSKINSKKKYDIIISDMNLKIKNDFSHIKILKDKFNPQKLIAISADNLEDVAKENGADYFYKKPLSVRLFDNNVKIVDLDIIKENEKLYGKEVLMSLYKEFIIYNKKKINDARIYISEKDYASVRNIFHALKSASLTFGMIEFSNYCKLIEDIDDLFISRSRIEELEEILYSSRDFIEAFRPKYLVEEG
jgi:two-component sensor histidine kinase/CheY-like chemotaxis protein